MPRSRPASPGRPFFQGEGARLGRSEKCAPRRVASRAADPAPPAPAARRRRGDVLDLPRRDQGGARPTVQVSAMGAFASAADPGPVASTSRTRRMRVLSRASVAFFEPKRRFSNCSSLGSGGRRTAVKKPAGSLARARFFFFCTGSRESSRARRARSSVSRSSRALVRLTVSLSPHSEPLRSTASASRAGSSSAAASRRSRGVSFASRCYPTGARLFSATSSRTTRRLGAAVPTAAAARRPARLSVPRPAARPLRRRPTPRGTSAGRVRGRVRIRTTRLSRRAAGRWTR
jgi:hypothetical protein